MLRKKSASQSNTQSKDAPAPPANSPQSAHPGHVKWINEVADAAFGALGGRIKRYEIRGEARNPGAELECTAFTVDGGPLGHIEGKFCEEAKAGAGTESRPQGKKPDDA